MGWVCLFRLWMFLCVNPFTDGCEFLSLSCVYLSLMKFLSYSSGGTSESAWRNLACICCKDLVVMTGLTGGWSEEVGGWEREVVAVVPVTVVGEVGDPTLILFNPICWAWCCVFATVWLCNWIRHTCVWSRVSPRIHKICPVRFMASCDREPEEPSSTRDEVASIISSGGPEPHVNFLGIFLVGIVVTICPQTRTPSPKTMHHSHWSIVRGAVEKARPPNWTMMTWLFSGAMITTRSRKRAAVATMTSFPKVDERTGKNRAETMEKSKWIMRSGIYGPLSEAVRFPLLLLSIPFPASV